MFRFSVDIIGKREVDRALTAMQATLTDIVPILKKIADDFYATMEERFDREGSYEGTPKWEPLSEGYRKTKEFFFPGKGILERTGALRESITRSNAPGSVFKIENGQLQIGSDLTVNGFNLLKLHSEGYYRPPIRPRFKKALAFYIGSKKVFAQYVKGVNVPARPVVMISGAQKERWRRIIHEELYNRLKPAWEEIQGAQI